MPARDPAPEPPTFRAHAIEGPVLVAGGAGYIGSHTVRALDRKSTRLNSSH